MHLILSFILVSLHFILLFLDVLSTTTVHSVAENWWRILDLNWFKILLRCHCFSACLLQDWPLHPLSYAWIWEWRAVAQSSLYTLTLFNNSALMDHGYSWQLHPFRCLQILSEIKIYKLSKCFVKVTYTTHL